MIGFESLGFKIGDGDGERYAGTISERVRVVFPAVSEALRALDVTDGTFSPEYYQSIESASRHFPRYPLEAYAAPDTLFDTASLREKPGNSADFIDFIASADEPEVSPREVVNSSNGVVENPDGSVNLAAARRKANACSKPGNLVIIGTSEKPTVVESPSVDVGAADDQFTLAA